MKLSIAFTDLENALLAQVNHRPITQDNSPGQVMVTLLPEAVPHPAETQQTNSVGGDAAVEMAQEELRRGQLPPSPIEQRPTEISPEAAEELPARQEGIDERFLLSPREITVLELVSEGQSNKYIARELDIAEPTVKCHVKSILRKLGVRNRFEAAMWVLRARGQLLP